MTLFAEFIRHATPEQKAVVYDEVMREVTQIQEATIDEARRFTESPEDPPRVDETDNPYIPMLTLPAKSKHA